MYLIITASPNAGGLTAACGRAALEGIKKAGGIAEIVDISALKLMPCLICGNGWGPCRDTAKCTTTEDIFPVLQQKVRESEGIALVTPVYWGQPSERMKYFLDRFRRCEALNKNGSAAQGKRADLIAAAGGSGNGTVSCLAEMDQWCRHVGAVPKERIGVTRFNREQILPAITEAAARMVNS
jgi:multimeric flavodoxin WrbA